MKKINFIDSIRQPIITEKATILSEYNKTVFKKNNGQIEKRSIEDAKKLLLKAGYDNGIDKKTGKPLIN